MSVTEEMIADAKRAFEQGEGLSLEYRLGNVLLAMRSKDHSIAVDDVRERVCRAICETKGYDPDAPAGETRLQWQCFTEIADAAITAIGSQSIEGERAK